VTARQLSLIIWEQAAKQIEEANDWWREHRQASPDGSQSREAKPGPLLAPSPVVDVANRPRRAVDLPRRLSGSSLTLGRQKGSAG
jgi:hypothetical protein